MKSILSFLFLACMHCCGFIRGNLAVCVSAAALMCHSREQAQFAPPPPFLCFNVRSRDWAALGKQ